MQASRENELLDLMESHLTFKRYTSHLNLFDQRWILIMAGINDAEGESQRVLICLINI